MYHSHLWMEEKIPCQVLHLNKRGFPAASRALHPSLKRCTESVPWVRTPASLCRGLVAGERRVGCVKYKKAERPQKRRGAKGLSNVSDLVFWEWGASGIWLQGRCSHPPAEFKATLRYGSDSWSRGAQARQGKGCLNLYFHSSILVFRNFYFSNLILSQKTWDFIT